MPFDRTNWRNDKILMPEQAAEVAAGLRARGLRLVTTNGSFDLLHVGHLDQLEEARRQGDVLFVGINTDHAIRAAKGPTRPLIPEPARVAMLAALVCVDFAVLMPGTYANEPMQSLLPAVQPHVHVNGPDYGAPTTWLEWPVMQRYGTRGHIISRRNDFSTSAIIRRIQSFPAGTSTP